MPLDTTPIRPTLRLPDPHERARHEDYGEGKTRAQEEQDSLRMLCWVSLACLVASSVTLWCVLYW